MINLNCFLDIVIALLELKGCSLSAVLLSFQPCSPLSLSFAENWRYFRDQGFEQPGHDAAIRGSKERV